MDLRAKVASNSPQLAIDPHDSQFVIMANRRDGPAFGCSLQISGDGGRHWVTDNPVLKLPAGADHCYAPEVAYDGSGRLYYLFVGLQGIGNSPMGVFLTTSSDGARSFGDPQLILGRERYMVRMIIDPDVGDRGRMHLVWLEARTTPPTGGLPPPPNPIMASYSEDGGGTFSHPVQISDTERQRVVAPTVSLGRDHALHVLYYDLGSDARDYEGLDGPTWQDPWSLVLTTSSDGGRHFGRGTVIDGHVIPPERVMLIYTMPPASLVTSPDGHIFVAWHDARNGDWDVFFRRSTDGGRSWDPPLRLNDDALHDGRHQYLPRLSVASDGRIDAIFYDRRSNVQNRGNDVYYTHSSNGGVSFAPNVKLTSLDFDSTVGPRYGVVSAKGLVEFGSRLGLVSTPSRAIAAWTDTRNDGRGFTAQDIFATQVDFEGGSPVGIVLRIVGLVSMVAGVGALIVAAGPRRWWPGIRSLVRRVHR